MKPAASSLHHQPDTYAVFGNPIHHSKSPQLQQAFAEQTQQSMHYSAECVALDGFKQAVDRFFQRGGKGLNITLPFKEDAYQYADTITPRASMAGAVNTLCRQAGGRLLGDNTDGKGLVEHIKRHLTWPITGQRILLLGAGGAVRGVLGPLIDEQPASILIANRSADKATALACHFSTLYASNSTPSKVPLAGSGLPQGLSHSKQPKINNIAFDLIINGTSASLSGQIPKLPASVLHPGTCCYDMMYSKAPTPFLHWCQQQGAQHVSDGLGMLVCQGAESFFQWRGIQPTVAPVIAQLRRCL